jgi:hypothetical protein
MGRPRQGGDSGVVNDCRLHCDVPAAGFTSMTDSQMLLAAAALLIAAVMLPIPSNVRGIFFVLLGGFYLLMGFGLGLRQIGSIFN